MISARGLATLAICLTASWSELRESDSFINYLMPKRDAGDTGISSQRSNSSIASVADMNSETNSILRKEIVTMSVEGVRASAIDSQLAAQGTTKTAFQIESQSVNPMVPEARQGSLIDFFDMSDMLSTLNSSADVRVYEIQHSQKFVQETTGSCLPESGGRQINLSSDLGFTPIDESQLKRVTSPRNVSFISKGSNRENSFFFDTILSNVSKAFTPSDECSKIFRVRSFFFVTAFLFVCVSLPLFMFID
jgi:hypothetical protein